MNTGWTPRGALGEAFANLASSPIRTLVMISGMAGVLSALVWAELTFTSQLKELEQRFATAGGYVAVIQGPNGLDASRCERLRDHDQIIAAGGFRGGGQITATKAPDSPFVVFEATHGLLAVWDPQERDLVPEGYIVGSAAAAELGLTTDSWIDTNTSAPSQVLVIDPTPRNQFAARAFIDLIPASGRIDQCWVEFQPEDFEAGLHWLSAKFAIDEAETRRNVDRDQFSPDAATQLTRRPQRWGWLAAGGAGSVIITLMALSRRSEVAVYRAFGLRRTGIVLMQQAEAWVLVGLSYIAGGAWTALAYAFTFELAEPDQILLALRTSGKAAAMMALLGPLGAALVGAGTPASLLKDR